ncbi:hypothetical protein DFH06DRAFT_1269111 [Mycena polygramma]|nr:hypothetical protein DFH06DRAFT_1269111 [Mycena polygramma]
MSKTLYTFGPSVWSAAAELALTELGYTEGDVAIQSVNLLEGENYSPWFLKLNPNGTIPTLEADSKVYTSTAEVIAALAKGAPTKVKSGSSFIETIHDAKYDPNFALLLARNDAELAAKSGFAGPLKSQLQAALDKYSQEAGAEEFAAFYEAKKSQNSRLAIFSGKASEEDKISYFSKSAAHFVSIKTAVFEVVHGALPESGFLGGAAPGEDDFHLGAWLARIASSIGAKGADDAAEAMSAAYGETIPAKVGAYWGAWTARTSWKKVYAGGLH